MKIMSLLVVMASIFQPVFANSYPVKDAKNCGQYRDDSKEINGTVGSVIMGEMPFLTLVMENDDELLMLPENSEALDFFRKNEGEKIRASYHKSDIFWPDDFSENKSGNCETTYFFESGKLLNKK